MVVLNKKPLGLAILAVLVLGVVFYGCHSAFENRSAEDRRVLARINNYKMTAQDFIDRVDFVLASKYFTVEPNEAKEELLDELITRNVLIQQAQRQNLDKERTFMREIERYWEQSLLKSVLKRKSEEIAEDIQVEDSEIINEYQRMKRKIFAQLLILNEQKAAEELSQVGADNFAQAKERFKEKIISDEPPKWWVLGDLPRYLEEPLFSLKVGQAQAIKSGNNWVLLRVLDEQEITIEPYQNLAAAIKKNIEKRKKEEILEKWITDLRKGTSIKINRKLLNEINLE